MDTQANNQESINKDVPTLGYQFLAFIIPIAGLIMYNNKKKDFPIKAKRYRLLAILGLLLGLVFRFLD